MKYLLITFFAIGIGMCASAQNYDRGGNRSRWRVEVYNNPSYGNSHYANNGFSRQDEINRIYDRRVTEIQNDYTLSPHKQRKMIRQINEERKMRLKAARRYERKAARKEKYSY